MINTYIQFPATGGGGATGSELIQMATSASGNYISGSTGQALQFGFQNPNISPNGSNMVGRNNTDGDMAVMEEDMSEEIEGYSEIIEADFSATLGYGTASTPTRTTQHVAFSTYELQQSQIANSTSSFDFYIGGYIRGWTNASTANNAGVSSPAWTIDSAALISSSISNGCSVSLNNTNDGRRTTQDNIFSTNGRGIYTTGSASSNLKQLILSLGGGRGSFTFPAMGDTFTLRVKADGTISGAAQTQRIHDIIVTWL
tara:strand:- start:1139 stop:1909 length:771 start_codon:yes stop_codon:yes gene_type:complete